MRQSEPRHVNWERNLLKTSFAILQSRGKLKQLGETLSRRSPGTNWTCSQHPFFGEYFIIMMKNSNRTKLPCAGKLKYIPFHLFKILTGQNLFIFSYSWKVVESPVYPPLSRQSFEKMPNLHNSAKIHVSLLRPPGNLFPLSALRAPAWFWRLQKNYKTTAISVSIPSLSGREELIALDDDWNKIVWMLWCWCYLLPSSHSHHISTWSRLFTEHKLM